MIRFDALGTSWWVECKNERRLEREIIKTVIEFESNYSRFKPSSQLSQLCRDGGFAKPSYEFIDLLRRGLKYYRMTNGVFDISCGGPLNSLGYGNGPKKQLADRLDRAITITRQGVTLNQDVSLDFGGFGKGYLIDKLFNFINKNSQAEDNIVVNGGGDIRFRLSEPGVPISNPTNNTQVIARLMQSQGALASSSKLHRKWDQYNHLISGGYESYDGQISQLSVYHDSACIADMLATACTLDVGLLSQLDNFQASALLVGDDGRTLLLNNFLAEVY